MPRPAGDSLRGPWCFARVITFTVIRSERVEEFSIQRPRTWLVGEVHRRSGPLCHASAVQNALTITLTVLCVGVPVVALIVVGVRPATTPLARVLRALALATGLGFAVYVVLNPLLALVVFGATAVGRGVGEPLVRSGRLPLYALPFALSTTIAPVTFALVLNYLRPDLMQPMLDHIFGYLIFAVISLLGVGGAGVVILVAVFKKSVPATVGTWLGSLVLCTFPAVFLVLFGPIVFAFMYGAVEPPNPP